MRSGEGGIFRDAGQVFGQAAEGTGLSSSKDVAVCVCKQRARAMASDGIWVVAVARAREATPHSGRAHTWNGARKKDAEKKPLWKGKLSKRGSDWPLVLRLRSHSKQRL